MPHHSHSCLQSPQRVMPLTFLSKGNLSSAYRYYECHYWLQFFSFQIRVSNCWILYIIWSLHWFVNFNNVSFCKWSSFVNFNHQFFHLHISFAKYNESKHLWKQIISCLLVNNIYSLFKCLFLYCLKYIQYKIQIL